MRISTSTVTVHGSILKKLGVVFSSYLFHNKLMNILQTIFNDCYETIQYVHHLKYLEIESIYMMIHCSDPFLGASCVSALIAAA